MARVVVTDALGTGVVITNGDLRNEALIVQTRNSTGPTIDLGNDLYSSTGKFDSGATFVKITFHANSPFSFTFTDLRGLEWQNSSKAAMVTMTGLDISIINGQALGVISDYFSGNDRFDGNRYGDVIEAGHGNDRAYGNMGFDSLWGDYGNDSLYGGAGNDRLQGDHGDDLLIGGIGKDRLIGGFGADTLDGGTDTGRDVFVFEQRSESPVGPTHDRVRGFTSGIDQIDLRVIDANEQMPIGQAFKFTATARANAVWVQDIGASLLVKADVTGDARADFEILVESIESLTATDFLL